MKYIELLKIVYGKNNFKYCKNVLEDGNICRSHNFKKYHFNHDIKDKQWFFTYSASGGYRISIRYEKSRVSGTSEIENNLDFSSSIFLSNIDIIQIEYYRSIGYCKNLKPLIEYDIINFNIPVHDIQELSINQLLGKYKKYKAILNYEVLCGVSKYKLNADINA